jgi:hypothetical protein
VFILKLEKNLEQLDLARKAARTFFEGSIPNQSSELNARCFTIATQRHFVWRFAVEEIGLSHNRIAKIYGVDRTSVRQAIKRLQTKCGENRSMAENYRIVREALKLAIE